MRVQAGMTYTELLRAATKAGMSVQIGTTTAYGGLTLGGVLATSAHGSGDKTISGLWDTVLEITWVDGTGKVSEVLSISHWHIGQPAESLANLTALCLYHTLATIRLWSNGKPGCLDVIVCHGGSKD